MNGEIRATAGRQQLRASPETPRQAGLEADYDAVTIGDVHAGGTERTQKVLPAKELGRIDGRYFARPFPERHQQQIENSGRVLCLKRANIHALAVLHRLRSLDVMFGAYALRGVWAAALMPLPKPSQIPPDPAIPAR
jgi:hypothetical protein